MSINSRPLISSDPREMMVRVMFNGEEARVCTLANLPAIVAEVATRYGINVVMPNILNSVNDFVTLGSAQSNALGGAIDLTRGAHSAYQGEWGTAGTFLVKAVARGAIAYISIQFPVVGVIDAVTRSIYPMVNLRFGSQSPQDGSSASDRRIELEPRQDRPSLDRLRNWNSSVSPSVKGNRRELARNIRKYNRNSPVRLNEEISSLGVNRVSKSSPSEGRSPRKRTQTKFFNPVQ